MGWLSTRKIKSSQKQVSEGEKLRSFSQEKRKMLNYYPEPVSEVRLINIINHYRNVQSKMKPNIFRKEQKVHNCPICGEKTEGSYSEGGIHFNVCEECYEGRYQQQEEEYEKAKTRPQ